MASIKCPQCGLVNWIEAEVCKRCKSALIPMKEVGAADSTGGSNEPETTLTVCGVCGRGDEVDIQNITRTYTPNWVWLFLPLGILPAGLLGMALQVKHSFPLPVCRKCMRRLSLKGVVSWASIVVCIFMIIMALGIGSMTKSWIGFLVPMAIAAAVAAFAGWFEKKANPRYVAFKRDRVEIDVPGKGRILVLDKRKFENARP